MGIASILVHVTLTAESEVRVRFAADLARRLDAALIGAAADDPAITNASAWLWEKLEAEAREWLDKAELRFRESAQAAPLLEWRGELGPVGPFLAKAAAAADLLVVGRGEHDPPDHRVTVDHAAMALQAGRPVLVSPSGCESLGGLRAVVAWKSVRECRRALADALPFLALFEETLVVGIGDKTDEPSLKDAVAFLTRHGIAARGEWRPRPPVGIASGLLDLAAEHEAGLIVAGAYGHNRLQEWVFGGVTRELMQSAPIPCFFSH